MKKQEIDVFVRKGILRSKEVNPSRIMSMLDSSKLNADVAIGIPLNDKSATLVLREIYESIRQLGDAKWGILGFEAQNHDVSLEILKSINIKNKFNLNYLSRFKKIRHDANYRGFRVSVSQAEEIIDFWNKCGKEIINLIKKEIGK